MPPNLKSLGISSPYHAAELERDLGIRFDDFTPEDSDTWKRQTLYLYQYAQTQTVTHAARTAGVTVSTAESWQSDNTLGFNQRLRISVLEYTDDMEVLFLERTRQPDSPASFMTTLLRAQMPEKYGPARYRTEPKDNDHDPKSTRPADKQTSLEDLHRDLQELKRLVGVAEPDHPDLAPVGGETQRGGSSLAPEPIAEEPSHSDLAPAGGETQRGGAPQHPAPSTQHPSGLNRRQRRELQRKHAPYPDTGAKRKGEKSHRARAPN